MLIFQFADQSQTERMAMVKGGAVAAIPGLGGGVDGNFTDSR